MSAKKSPILSTNKPKITAQVEITLLDKHQTQYTALLFALPCEHWRRFTLEVILS